MRWISTVLLCALSACDGGSLGPGRDASPNPGTDAGRFDAGPRRDAGPAVDAGPPTPVDAGLERIDAGRPLLCDEGFEVFGVPTSGGSFDVSYTHATGFAFIGMNATAPATTELLGIDGDGPYTWTFRVAGAPAGVIELVFTRDMGTPQARCEVLVASVPRVDAGMPDAGPAGPDAGPMPPPTGNRFGIGFVSPGNAAQLDLSADLTGPGGHVKLIFDGVVPGMSGPQGSWVDATRMAYERGLVPVVRFAPPWGDRRVRNQSDDGSGLRYTSLAASYVAILRGLPIPSGAPFYVEVHNEPNLCYEWLCDRGVFPDDRITYQRTAQEYAAMLRDVADAIHATGDDRYLVVNGGLAPGGVRWCECNGTSEAGFEPGITANEFLAAMNDAVPGVFGKLDAFASHSYPASGAGFGFFVPYESSGPGLRFFEMELATIGRSDLGVLMTETGWPRAHGGTTYASEDQQAQWTVQAYQNVWLTHPNIIAVMPFILQDAGSWDGFAWVDGGGGSRRVYRDVRSLRCGMIGGRCP